MKANELPEKIYIDTPNHDFWYRTKDKNSIEYVRTDSILEWIKNKVDKYIVDTPMCHYFDYKRAIEDFIEYMKGE